MTDRRALLKSAVALLAAPFARFARAEVPTVANSAPTYRKGEITATYRHMGDAGSIYESFRSALGTVNTLPMRLTLGSDGQSRKCRQAYPPGTLLLVDCSTSHTTGGRNPLITVRYTYNTAGLNRVLVPGQGYRDVTPALYPDSDFAGFREVHEGLVWKLVQK